MLKIIRKYLNNRIKKSRILPPKHELYSPLKTDLDVHQVVQGSPWPISDHRVPLRERSPSPAFPIFKFVSFEVCTLLLVRGSKGWACACVCVFVHAASSNSPPPNDPALHFFSYAGLFQGAEWLRGKSTELRIKLQWTDLRIKPLLLFYFSTI